MGRLVAAVALAFGLVAALPCQAQAASPAWESGSRTFYTYSEHGKTTHRLTWGWYDYGATARLSTARLCTGGVDPVYVDDVTTWGRQTRTSDGATLASWPQLVREGKHCRALSVSTARVAAGRVTVSVKSDNIQWPDDVKTVTVAYS